MPAWWGRKSSKTKLQQQQSHGGGQFNFIKSPIRDAVKKGKDKAKSFDEVPSRGSPRTSKDFTSAGATVGGSSTCCDSDGGEKKGLPLPTPSVLSTQSCGNDPGVGMGSGSFSASSVSSSGSYDDHPISHSKAIRGQVDIKSNAGSKSPGPGSRGPTSPTSPLHTRLHGLTLDSPTGKQDDVRSQCHPLPRPPGSLSLSKWKKGKLLGRGTFGHVYLGFNSESGQMCAIKEVKVLSDDQTSRECLKQLNQEINLLSQLSHPNIVQYYGSELGEESLSVFLEYVSGGSIHKLLQEYGAFKEPVVQNYTRQIVSGLAYLHGRNTVHRDIKGANILVDPNGEIKLADFGMAKHINSSSSMLSFKGSPYWMAPEVVMNTNGYSQAVDIWSLGCTILEMATSKPPWSQYEGVAAIFKIGNSRDTPEIPDHLSNDAKNFITWCLQRDPASRPSALQLLDHSFIRDQSATRATNVNITRDAFPYMFEGSRTPPTAELNSNRATSADGDYAAKPVVANSRVSRSPRDSMRTITSLPVSPCSSPLRQYGTQQRSCFLSPPHPTYSSIMGQNAYTLSDLSSYPVRWSSTYTLDAWRETSLNKAHTPGGSPRTRFI